MTMKHEENYHNRQLSINGIQYIVNLLKFNAMKPGLTIPAKPVKECVYKDFFNMFLTNPDKVLPTPFTNDFKMLFFNLGDLF